MSKAKTVKEVLVAARWILENVGWCQEYFYKTKDGEGYFSTSEFNLAECGGACSSGAMILVEAEGELIHKAMDLLEEVIDISHYGHSIPCWNDTTARTKEQVLAVFDKAIERA